MGTHVFGTGGSRRGRRLCMENPMINTWMKNASNGSIQPLPNNLVDNARKQHSSSGMPPPANPVMHATASSISPVIANGGQYPSRNVQNGMDRQNSMDRQNALERQKGLERQNGFELQHPNNILQQMLLNSQNLQNSQNHQHNANLKASINQLNKSTKSAYFTEF